MAGVSTPCTRLCVLDAATAMCRGCGRTLAEIGAWASLTEPERVAIMATLPARRAAAAAPAGDAAGDGARPVAGIGA